MGMKEVREEFLFPFPSSCFVRLSGKLCNLIFEPLHLVMINLDEFRAGGLSIPSIDGDDLPSGCFRCSYLSHKGFSTAGDDIFYYCCAYSWPDKISPTIPPCLQDGEINGS
jgi:hypothetical protein